MGDRFPTVTAAAVQAAPIFLDREQSVEKACDLIAEAGRGGADVTVFPEGFVPGHPLWHHFHPSTSEVSQRLGTELFKNAVAVPGPSTERLARAAEKAGTYVVMGVCEKAANTTGAMYNSQVFFSPNGDLLGTHQKLTPTSGEQLVHAEGRAGAFGTVETDFGPMSGLICGENWNPLAIYALAAEHTRVHATSWPQSFRGTKSMPDRVRTVSRAVAQMTKATVVSACGVLDDRTIDLLELDDADAERIGQAGHAGGSLIVGPGMDVVAGPMEADEGIIYGDVDLEEGVTRKLTHDFAGHYNRQDVFGIDFDRQTHELVQERVDDSSGE